MTELYKKYRPQKLSELVGQPDVVNAIKGWGKPERIPHALLLVGPSGCGKTTLARILRRLLGCSDSDYSELNTADFRGIDMVRDVRSRMMLSPIGGGKCRVWMIDECHQLTKDAQDALLKLLEDTPEHVWFILATTDPRKLIVTLRNRCTLLTLKSLRDDEMARLLGDVCSREGITILDVVLEKITSTAEGSPRKALVLLNQVVGVEGEEAQLAAIVAGEAQREAIEVCRLLMNPRTRWGDMAKVLRGIDDLDNQAEGVRRLVLAYMTTVALGGGKSAARAMEVIERCRDNYFDSGKAGLVLSCWESVGG